MMDAAVPLAECRKRATTYHTSFQAFLVLGTWACWSEVFSLRHDLSGQIVEGHDDAVNGLFGARGCFSDRQPVRN